MTRNTPLVVVLTLLFLAPFVPLGDGLVRMALERPTHGTLVVFLERGSPRLAFWHGEFAAPLTAYPWMAYAWYAARLRRI